MADTDISGVALFQGLPEKELKQIQRDLSEVRHPEGKRLAVIGADGVGFMCILEGEVEVHTADGRTRVLGPGNHFGEMALLDGQGRSSEVVTRTPVRLAGVPEWSFKSFLTSHPEVAYRMLQHMSRRLREAEKS